MKPIQTGLKVHRQISLKTAETVKKYTETNGKADESSQAADEIIRIKTKAVPQADKVPRRVYRVVKTFKRNVKHANRSRKALKETEQEIVKNSRDIKRTIKKVKAVHNARTAAEKRAESSRTARIFTESRNSVHKVKVKQNTVKQANKKYIKTAERYGANRIKKHTPHVNPGRAVSASHGRSVKSAALARQRRMAKAAKNAKEAKQAAQSSLKGIKTMAKLAMRIAKALARTLQLALKAVAEFITWLFSGGIVVVMIVAVISVFAVILSSAFAIFFPDSSSTLTMREAVSLINTEYSERVNSIIEENDDGSIDLIQYTGKKAQWKYVIAIYAAKYSGEDGNVLTVDENAVKKLSKVFFDMHDITYSFSEQNNGQGSMLTVITIDTAAKTIAEMMDMYNFSNDQRLQVSDILADYNDEFWSQLLFGLGNSNGSYALVQIAREQLGNVGGQPYWSWYGFNGRVEWCACFVSWCAAQCGYIDQGVFPMFSYCPSGVEWFKSKGMWTDGSSMPRAGDIIFFDWNGDGVSDHVGIVEFVSNETVHTIEGNSGDAVVQNTYDLGNSCIMGYGMLAQISGLNGDTVEEQCYNYLRAEGYSEIAACAVIANFHGECNCDPGIYGHDYGDAAGIMQWTGPNKTIFFNWCNDNAMNWTNLESQLYFYSYWLNDVNNGEWSRISGSRHPDFQHVYSTEEFKQISADTYGGDIARALYEATAMFVDDMERPYDTWGAETRRYTYAVQFYNYLVAGGIDGTSQSAWRPEYANDIGVFHLN